MADSVISRELIRAIKSQYSLPWLGTHGVSHWARVRENGLRLAAASPGAIVRVIEFFSVFHDSRRVNEGIDHDHGRRGAAFARQLRGSVYDLPEDEFKLLVVACTDHTKGQTAADLTVQCCWDADRLDLLRVRIVPDTRFLCTMAGKQSEMIEWANERARQRTVPEFAKDEWDAGG